MKIILIRLLQNSASLECIEIECGNIYTLYRIWEDGKVFDEHFVANCMQKLTFT